MKADIKCATCGELLGTIEKDEIMDADSALYQKMEICSQGHKSSGTLDITDDTPGISDDTP